MSLPSTERRRAVFELTRIDIWVIATLTAVMLIGVVALWIVGREK
jgi:hypothetical protein